MSEPMQGPVTRPPRAERTTTSCGECRRRKQKVRLHFFVRSVSSQTPPTRVSTRPPRHGWSRLPRVPRSLVVSEHHVDSRFSQCNQGQPCGNCARRFPQPACEYKSSSRCVRPSGITSGSEDHTDLRGNKTPERFDSTTTARLCRLLVSGNHTKNSGL
jgi:hypothetical protein